MPEPTFDTGGDVVVSGTGGSFEAGCDLARSARWVGMASVKVGGETVDFSVSPASGTGYR